MITIGSASPLLTRQTVAFVDLAWLSKRVAAAVGSDDARPDMKSVHQWLTAIGWLGYSYLRTYVYEGQYDVDHPGYKRQRNEST
jgi:hypothetical protein